MFQSIIHLLGGITQQENHENKNACAEMGRYYALNQVREQITQRYGLPADQQLAELDSWVRGQIELLIKELTKQ